MLFLSSANVSRNGFKTYDDPIRMALIKVAEITVASTTEPLLSKMIMLQTPAAETPGIMTPRIRISMSGPIASIKMEDDGESP